MCGILISSIANERRTVTPANQPPEKDILADEVWFTSKPQGGLAGFFKLVYDDCGTIRASAGRLQFLGKNGTIEMPAVTSIKLIGPIVPWANVVAFALLNVGVLLASKAGVCGFLTPDNPFTYVLPVGLTILAMVRWPMRWLEVQYGGKQKEPALAYFTLSSVGDRWSGRLTAFHKRLLELSVLGRQG
jgi:hypothetical protein